jgi:hypothetical protein
MYQLQGMYWVGITGLGPEVSLWLPVEPNGVGPDAELDVVDLIEKEPVDDCVTDLLVVVIMTGTLGEGGGETGAGMGVGDGGGGGEGVTSGAQRGTFELS